MTITIINDCKDANAVGRQNARIQSLFNLTPNFIGVSNDIEAAGNLIDALDAHGDSEGIILVNVAPRNGMAKKWPNGTPFGYFYYKNTLVVSSIDGYTLSLVKKFKLADEILVFETSEAVNELILKDCVSPSLKEHIINTQFRSYELTPRIAAYLHKYKELECITPLAVNDIADVPQSVWLIDNFGNCKTTLCENDISLHASFAFQGKNLSVFNRLKDVPNNTIALIIGSSGIGNNRFLELVYQGNSAANYFDISTSNYSLN